MNVTGDYTRVRVASSLEEATLDSIPRVSEDEMMFHRGPEVSTRQLGFRKDGPMTIIGITNPRWYTLKKIPLDQIIPSQHTIAVEGIRSYLRNPPSEIPAVCLNLVTGNYHVESGHTRLAAEWLKGAREVLVQLFEYDREPGYSHRLKQVRPSM